MHGTGSSRRRRQRVTIGPLGPADGREFVAASLASVRLHGPWVSPPITLKAFRAKLARMASAGDFAFVIRRLDTGALVGYAEVTNVVRGVFQSGYLGYHAFAGSERQGLMTEGIRLVARHAFKVFRMHRLEANVQPENLASIALLKACGFAKEGYSPRYLKIRGRWRDHERWALLAR